MPILLAVAGVLGLVVGRYLARVIARVPKARSPRFPLVELATALLFLLVGWATLTGFLPGTVDATSIRSIVAAAAVFAAFAWFAASGLALALIDLDTRRLPNAIVYPSITGVTALFATAALLTGDYAPLLRAVIGGTGLFAFYWALALLRSGGMGGGDVKLAGLSGLVLGWTGWGALIVGAFAAFLLGGIFSLALLLRRKATRQTTIPFGPWMLLGAALGIAAGGRIAGDYIGVIT